MGLRVAVTAVALPLVAFAAGCSSSAQVTTTTSTVASNPFQTVPRISGPSDLLVTDQAVAKAGAASPWGVVLRWWQALQAGNVAAARSFYARSVDTSALGREIRGLTYPARFDFEGSHPLVTVDLRRSNLGAHGQTKHAGSVRVDTYVDGAVFSKSDPSKVVFWAQTPVRFTLVREGGEWKLANDDYLEQALTFRPPRAR